MRTMLFASLVLALALAAGPPAHALDSPHDCITADTPTAPDAQVLPAEIDAQEHVLAALPDAIADLHESAVLPPPQEMAGIGCSSVTTGLRLVTSIDRHASRFGAASGVWMGKKIARG